MPGSILTPRLRSYLRRLRQLRAHDASESLEVINYFDNASWFALDQLGGAGALSKLRLLSAAVRVHQLADYVPLFERVYHCSTVPVALPVSARTLADRLVLLDQDFFTLPPLEVDCVISHSTFHCLDDSRYHNPRPAGDALPSPRAYAAAPHLRTVLGNRRVPCFITVAVNRDECFMDNNSWLSHDRFVDSFAKAGFTLRDHFFDYLTFGAWNPSEFLGLEHRRSRELPRRGDNRFRYVSGTYYFD